MITRRRQMELCAVLALAFGVALRLWFISHVARIAGDTLIYGDIAKNWLEHGVYGFSQSAKGLRPTLIRLPGYPLFLALCFRLFGIEHYTAVMYAQCHRSADLPAGGRSCRSAIWLRAVLVALWVAALCPFMASYVSAPLTETLSLPLFALTFYALDAGEQPGKGSTLALGNLGGNGLCSSAAAGAGSAGRRRRSRDALDGPGRPIAPCTPRCQRCRISSSRGIRSASIAAVNGRPVGRCSALCCSATGALDAAELAHLPCVSAARASLCDRSRRDCSRRFSTLVSHLGHRFCLHRGRVLEL